MTINDVAGERVCIIMNFWVIFCVRSSYTKTLKNLKKTKNLKTCPKNLGFSSPCSSLLPVVGCETCCHLRCVWRIIIAFSVSVEGKFVWLRLQIVVMYLFQSPYINFLLTFLLTYPVEPSCVFL